MFFGQLITAMITPFHVDMSVNYTAAAELANQLIADGSNALVVAGSTGEGSTLTLTEKLKLFSVILDAVGDRARVIANAGSNDTYASIELTQQAEKLGMHGAMIVSPYYNKPPEDGYYQHFKAISENTALPLVVYNHPGRTGINISPTLVEKLTHLKNIIAIKESSGSMEQVSEIIKITPQSFSVYSGDDSLLLPFLAVGGAGVISTCSHVVGRQMREMIDTFLNGNIEKARSIHYKLFPLFKAMFMNTNPIIVKSAVNLLGRQSGPLRLPLISATSDETAQIRNVMEEIGVIKK